MDDFYSAFKEMFKKISDNIVRYEVRLQWKIEMQINAR
jgi:hypothetical protein